MRIVGIDVQVRRGCAFMVLNESGRMLEAGWIGSDSRPAEEVRTLVGRLSDHGPVWVGIDAPRRALPAPRSLSFRKGRWEPLQGVGRGRHCEIVVKSLGLANPQWTPLAEDAPEWMRLGFTLFEALADRAHVSEVFPTATYNALRGMRDAPEVTISLRGFAPGPKDMLDAAAAAVTVMAFAQGRGHEVGGGDGLGTIVLPRPLPSHERESEVHDWPGARLDT